MNKHEKELLYTECKTSRCPWKRFNPLVPPRGDVTISYRCANGCTSERHDRFNRHTGERTARTYKRPLDWKKYGVRLTLDELRLALMRHDQERQRSKNKTYPRRLRAVS